MQTSQLTSVNGRICRISKFFFRFYSLCLRLSRAVNVARQTVLRHLVSIPFSTFSAPKGRPLSVARQTQPRLRLVSHVSTPSFRRLSDCHSPTSEHALPLERQHITSEWCSSTTGQLQRHFKNVRQVQTPPRRCTGPISAAAAVENTDSS